MCGVEVGGVCEKLGKAVERKVCWVGGIYIE